MSFSGAVGVAEMRAWQIRGAAVLLDLLTVAHTADLPLLTWQIGSTPMLHGRVDGVYPGEMRAAFEEWREFLNPGEEWSAPSPAGTVLLHCERTGWGEDKHIRVVVVATVLSDNGEG